MDERGPTDDLYEGLRALAADAFPRRCPSCHRIYLTAEDFLRQTEALDGGRSGLKAGRDDRDRPVVELFRNCVCGSTLMDLFSDRRGGAEGDLKRRAQFEALVGRLCEGGMAPETARRELRLFLRGKGSLLIEQRLREP